MSEWREGQRAQIVRITDSPDEFHHGVYREIYLKGGTAFPCSREWFEREQPAVGDVLGFSAQKGLYVVERAPR